MTTLAISSALAVGSVSFASLLKDTAISTSANGIVGYINLARSEAIRRQTEVKICPSAGHARCASTDAWQQPTWLMYVDANHNNDADAGEVVQIHEIDTKQITFKASNNEKQLTYLPSGTLHGSVLNRTFALCDPSGKGLGRYVVINVAGRSYISKKTGNEKVRCS
ncbi:MAG: GspH/FimT family pseudopilin [Gammaproteobacteria bacterium]|nr:GspH/FimT family pseudopilin [Gammaproteobacteria bacterium]